MTTELLTTELLSIELLTTELLTTELLKPTWTFEGWVFDKSSVIKRSDVQLSNLLRRSRYMYPYSWVQRFPRENNASCCRMSHEMLHLMINYVLNRNKFKNIHEKWEIRMTSSKGLFLARWRLCILSSIFSDYLPIFLTWNSFDCWLFWGNKL